MDAEYLKHNIGEVLALALSEVVIANPTDPVDYLARWLMNHVDTINQETEKKAAAAKLRAEDAAAADAAAKKEAAEAAHTTAKVDEESKNVAELENYLNTATTMSGLMEGFIGRLKTVSGASNVYVGVKAEGDGNAPAADDGGGDEEEGDGDAPSNDVIKYVAATEGQEFMLENKLRGGTGVTFQVYKEDAAKEEEEEAVEEEEEGEAKPVAAVVEVEDKSIYIANVLLGKSADKINFWRLPNLGSYFAMRLPYEACLNEKTLETAIEKESEILELKKTQEGEAEAATAAASAEAAAEGGAADDGEEDAPEGEGGAVEAKAEVVEEEAPEDESDEAKAQREQREAEAAETANELFLISHLPKEKMDYVVCLDTLDSGARFTDVQIELIKKFIKLFKSNLVRLDRELFKEERLKRATFAELEEGVVEPSVEDQSKEKDVIAAQLNREGLPATPADIQFKYRQNVVIGLKMMIAEFRAYNVFRGPIEVLQALFYLLDYSKNEVADTDNKPVWGKMRLKFNDELFHKIEAYNPRAEQMRGKGNKFATVKAIKALLKGLDAESIKKKNYPLSEMFGYVTDAVTVKVQAVAERTAAKKAAKDAEAAAIAEAAGEGAAAEAVEEPAAAEDAE